MRGVGLTGALHTDGPRGALCYGKQLDAFEAKQAHMWKLIEKCCEANGVPANTLPTINPASVELCNATKKAFAAKAKERKRAAARAAEGGASEEAGTSAGGASDSRRTDEAGTGRRGVTAGVELVRRAPRARQR